MIVENFREYLDELLRDGYTVRTTSMARIQI